MNIADKVNTVLDLSGYNSLETQFDLTDPTTLITLLGEILALGGICLLFFGLISVSEKARKIAEGGICGMVLGALCWPWCSYCQAPVNTHSRTM